MKELVCDVVVHFCYMMTCQFAALKSVSHSNGNKCVITSR